MHVSPEIHMHKGHIIIAETVGLPCLGHPLREPDFGEVPEGFPGPAALLSASQEPSGQSVSAYEEVIALRNGPLGEPHMIHNRLRIGVEAPQERGAGIEVGTFIQWKGDLELSATHVEEAGIAKRGSSPATDDAREAGTYQVWLSSCATDKLPINVHL